jgi:hypothetical protein
MEADYGVPVRIKDAPRHRKPVQFVYQIRVVFCQVGLRLLSVPKKGDCQKNSPSTARPHCRGMMGHLPVRRAD